MTTSISAYTAGHRRLLPYRDGGGLSGDRAVGPGIDGRIPGSDRSFVAPHGR